MRFISESVTDGVRERLFTVGHVPGTLWTPADAAGPRPLVLIGHGGGQHKKEPSVLARATAFVRSCGFAVAAIDAPGTGDRPEHPEIRRLVATIETRAEAGAPAGSAWPELCDLVAAELVPDWRTTLDALEALDTVGRGPVGYHGLSQGGEMGIRLAAVEPRITAAVLGLIGSPWLLGPAAEITVPVEFLLQWDDEEERRDDVLRVFGALGAAEKTLHANAGGHHRVPMFEVDSAVRFFGRHLGTPAG